MTRPRSDEFSAKIKEQAYARALKNGSGGWALCENKACRCRLYPGKFHFDHILPAALGGKPTLANCAVLCIGCHKTKTAMEDVPRIRKADRQRRAHIGAERQKAPIPSRPKREKPAPRFDHKSLSPRQMYEDAK